MRPYFLELKMNERDFVRRVISVGGRVAVVGGWVRDFVRSEKPKDKDYVVSGLDEAIFCDVFPEVKRVGRAFPVFLAEIDGRGTEIALARTERKSGTGYRGFETWADGKVSLEEDLSRRDTTINAMAFELFSDGKEPLFLDPFGGQSDVKRGQIRAVSERFTEDPVRALRASRQAALFGYDIEPRTLTLMGECRDELLHEPGERIFGELARALEAPKPSAFFRWLLKANLLDAVFPEIFSLIGKIQPEAFHPEGDAFEHTMLVLDNVAQKTENTVARFAALVHDIGKGRTPDNMLPHHYGHEERGLDVLNRWNLRMIIPRLWRRTAEFVIKEHMRACRLKKPGKIAKLILNISRLPILAKDVICVFEADNGKLPPYLSHYESYLREILSVSGKDAPKSLRGEKIGEWVLGKQSMAVGVETAKWNRLAENENLKPCR